MRTNVIGQNTTSKVGSSTVVITGNLAFTNGAGTAGFESQTIINEWSIIKSEVVNLAAGNNLITVPQSAAGLVIIPMAENTGSYILKGNSGDTGVTLHNLAPAVLPFMWEANAAININWLPVGVYEQEPVTVDNTTDKVTLTAHGLTNGDRVRFDGAPLPTGLVENVWYYVVSANTDDFKVSETLGGTPIDFTDTGTTVSVTTSQRLLFVWI